SALMTVQETAPAPSQASSSCIARFTMPRGGSSAQRIATVPPGKAKAGDAPSGLSSAPFVSRAEGPWGIFILHFSLIHFPQQVELCWLSHDSHLCADELLSRARRPEKPSTRGKKPGHSAIPCSAPGTLFPFIPL